MTDSFFQTASDLLAAQATAFAKLDTPYANSDVLDAWISLRPKIEEMRTQLVHSLAKNTSEKQAIYNQWAATEKQLVKEAMRRLGGSAKTRLVEELNKPMHRAFKAIFDGQAPPVLSSQSGGGEGGRKRHARDQDKSASAASTEMDLQQDSAEIVSFSDDDQEHM